MNSEIKKYYKIAALLLPFYLYFSLYWATLFTIISFLLIHFSVIKDKIEELDWREVIFFAYMFHLFYGERNFVYVGISKLYITEITIAILVFAYRKELLRLKKTLAIYYLLALIAGIWAIAYFPQYKINALRDALMLGYVIWVPIVYVVFNNWKKYDLFFDLVKVLIVVDAVYYLHKAILVFTGQLILNLQWSTGFRFGVGIIVPTIAVLILLLPQKGFDWKFKIAAAILLISAFTTFHRSMFLGVIVAAIPFFLMGNTKTRKTMIISGVAGLVLIVAFIFYYSTILQINLFEILRYKFSAGSGDVNYRVLAWQLALKDFKDHFLLGFGVGRPLMIIIGNKFYNSMNMSYWQISHIPYANAQPHNSYLNILARFGIFNFMLFVGALLYPLRKFRFISRLRKLDSQWFNQYLLLIGFMIFMFVFASFNVVLESPFQGVPFWISIGLVLRYSHSGYLRIYRLKKAQNVE